MLVSTATCHNTLPSIVLFQSSLREDRIPQWRSQALETAIEQVEYNLRILIDHVDIEKKEEKKTLTIVSVKINLKVH